MKKTKVELEAKILELEKQIEYLKSRLVEEGDTVIRCFVTGCGNPAKYEGWHVPGGGMMYRRQVCAHHVGMLGPKKG